MLRLRYTSLSIVFAAVELCTAQVQPLAFSPIASEGSTALDRIVMISAGPNLLHIYDPATTNDITVALPKPPLSLGVSADGLRAVAGHDGLLTFIDLTSASVTKTIAITGQASNITLGDTYVMFWGQTTGGASGVNLQTGAPITGNSGLAFFLGTNGVFNADQTAYYLADDGSSPDDMQKVTFGNGQIASSNSWPYHGDYPNCGPYYLSSDGSRIYTSCGTVVHVSSDPTLDMYYLRTLPAASVPFAGLSEAPASKLLAVIPSAYSYTTPATTADVQVQLFQTDYLLPAGNIAILPVATPVGSFAAHGKAVFFSRDASKLFVVAQADSKSNLTNPFVVEVIPLQTSPTCAVTFTNTAFQVSAAGSYGSLTFTAAPDCFYTATSNSNWITLSAGAYGSGNGTLQWIVRPNNSSQPRTGVIALNGQNCTIQQSAAPATLPNPAPLSFNIVDSDYSYSLNRIVMVSSSPNELHIYDPTAQADVIVPLVLPPFAVSVAPDGLHAAVGHDGWISYIDLQAGKVNQTFQIVSDVYHVLLAGNGYIYGFPQRDWSDIYSLQISSGTVTGTSAIYEGRIPRLEPNGNYFYASSDGWFSKWDITKGVAVSFADSPGGGLNSNLWLHQDGTELIGANAKVYTSSDVEAQDVQYVGALPGLNTVQWAANSSALKSTAIVPGTNLVPGSLSDTQVMFFGDAYLGSAGSVSLPQFSSGGKNYAGHGLFAFWNNSATALYAVERADSTSNLLSTDAIYTISASAGCAATPLGAFSTLAAGGGFGSAAVSAGAGCVWNAVSGASWLNITTGAIGAGPATISWSASANTGTANRTTNITLGGLSYPVTQLGTAATALALSSSNLSFSTTWTSTSSIPSQTFSVNAGTGPFTLTATPNWITVSPGSSNAWTVSVDPTGLPAAMNVGVITVKSGDGQIQTVTVTFSITPKLTVSPGSLSFQYGPGDPLPVLSLSIANGTASGSTFSAYGQYLTLSTSSGTLPITIQVSPISALGTSTYTSSISVTSNNQTIVIPVQIVHTGVAVSVNAITDAANFLPGPVSPGEIAVIWGSNLGPANLSVYTLTSNRLPTSLSGTMVTVNGTLAPIIYTSSGAVCVIVPYEIAGKTSAGVVVSYSGSASAQFTQPVAPAAPHFFTGTGTGTGQIAALNADYSVNNSANPSSAGSIVVLYATGEGVTSPPGVDGSLVGSNLTQPLANVGVTIGGQVATVLYAGGSPGEVEGLLQLNVRIPAGTPAGNVPVSLTIGQTTGPAGTIAVGP